jgi:hypothetical protein
MHESFVDLDELLLRCKDKTSRKFIQEAILCYRAGAFRSCIVSTWNAVVFDFLYKLRELSLSGDKKAEKRLEEFDRLQKLQLYKDLWQFEKSIPTLASTEFELISIVEKSDIERLFDDRSRCAHPSMTSLEEPFEATAELARYHLRSAVTHLLARPPVQGRAAKERILTDISSEYFPTDSDSARTYFEKGPLARARVILIKDVITVLTKDLLIEDLTEDDRLRRFAALNAISDMYYSETRDILNNHLSSGFILNKVADENWDKVIFYLGNISTWDNVAEPYVLKTNLYVDKIEIFESPQRHPRKFLQKSIKILEVAAHIDFLRKSVRKKFDISLSELLALNMSCKDDLFKENILIPILQELSQTATLGELSRIRSETTLKSEENVQGYIQIKVKQASLNELCLLTPQHEDDWLIDLAEVEIQEKLEEANLKDLLAAKQKYSPIRGQSNIIMSLFDNCIRQQCKEESDGFSLEEILQLIVRYGDAFFINLIEPALLKRISNASLDELLVAQSKFTWASDILNPEILESHEENIKKHIDNISFNELIAIYRSHSVNLNGEFIKPILKLNIPLILDMFSGSKSYEDASNNTSLIIMICEYLSKEQWNLVLESFCCNNQIYGSSWCNARFESLFLESLEINGFDRSIWLKFCQRLNELYGSQTIIKLKRLINSRLG